MKRRCPIPLIPQLKNLTLRRVSVEEFQMQYGSEKGLRWAGVSEGSFELRGEAISLKRETKKKLEGASKKETLNKIISAREFALEGSSNSNCSSPVFAYSKYRESDQGPSQVHLAIADMQSGLDFQTASFGLDKKKKSSPHKREAQFRPYHTMNNLLQVESSKTKRSPSMVEAVTLAKKMKPSSQK